MLAGCFMQTEVGGGMKPQPSLQPNKFYDTGPGISKGLSPIVLTI